MQLISYAKILNQFMCQISQKLKLCTCAGLSSHQKDYWTLYRFNKEKSVIIVGDIILPAYISKKENDINKRLLVALLNEENVFDIPVELQSKDRLSLHFDFESLHGTLHYGFEYRNGKWRYKEYDHFLWMQHYDEVRNGCIGGNRNTAT